MSISPVLTTRCKLGPERWPPKVGGTHAPGTYPYRRVGGCEEIHEYLENYVGMTLCFKSGWLMWASGRQLSVAQIKLHKRHHCCLNRH